MEIQPSPQKSHVGLFVGILIGILPAIIVVITVLLFINANPIIADAPQPTANTSSDDAPAETTPVEITPLTIGYDGGTFTLYESFADTARSVAKSYDIYRWEMNSFKMRVTDVESFLTNNYTQSEPVGISTGSIEIYALLPEEDENRRRESTQFSKLSFYYLTVSAFAKKSEISIDGKTFTPRTSTPQDIIKTFGKSEKSKSAENDLLKESEVLFYHINGFEIRFDICSNFLDDSTNICSVTIVNEKTLK